MAWIWAAPSWVAAPSRFSTSTAVEGLRRERLEHALGEGAGPHEAGVEGARRQRRSHGRPRRASRTPRPRRGRGRRRAAGRAGPPAPPRAPPRPRGRRGRRPGVRAVVRAALVVGRDEDAVGAAHRSSRGRADAPVGEQQDVDPLQPVQQGRQQVAAQPPRQAAPRGGRHRQPGHAALLGHAHHRVRQILLRDREEVRAQRDGQAADEVALTGRVVVQAPLGHDDVQLGAQPSRGPPGRAGQALRAVLGPHDHHHPLHEGGRGALQDHARAGRVALHALVHRVGHLAEGHLAEGPEIGGGEEVQQGRLDPFLGVHLPSPQARLQRLGRQVDEHHLVGVEEQLVGDRLADAHARQLEDAVVEALEVLDVDGRDDVDAGELQHLDVLVTLRARHAGRVGVRELVHEGDLGRARDHRIDVHVAQRHAAVLDLERGDDLQALRHRGGLGPPVGLQPPDDDVLPVAPPLLSLLEHRVRLADPGRHADVHLQPPPNRTVSATAVSRPSEGRA